MLQRRRRDSSGSRNVVRLKRTLVVILVVIALPALLLNFHVATSDPRLDTHPASNNLTMVTGVLYTCIDCRAGQSNIFLELPSGTISLRSMQPVAL